MQKIDEQTKKRVRVDTRRLCEDTRFPACCNLKLVAINVFQSRKVATLRLFLSRYRT